MIYVSCRITLMREERPKAHRPCLGSAVQQWQVLGGNLHERMVFQLQAWLHRMWKYTPTTTLLSAFGISSAFAACRSKGRR